MFGCTLTGKDRRRGERGSLTDRGTKGVLSDDLRATVSHTLAQFLGRHTLQGRDRKGTPVRGFERSFDDKGAAEYPRGWWSVSPMCPAPLLWSRGCHADRRSGAATSDRLHFFPVIPHGKGAKRGAEPLDMRPTERRFYNNS